MSKLLAFVATLGAVSAASAKELWLYWPPYLSQPYASLSIVEVKLNLTCAEVRSVRRIPSDWNIQVTRPISAKSQFRAEAGHGASNLPNLLELDGVIGINVEKDDCFEASAQIIQIEKETKVSGKELRWEARPSR